MYMAYAWTMPQYTTPGGSDQRQKWLENDLMLNMSHESYVAPI